MRQTKYRSSKNRIKTTGLIYFLAIKHDSQEKKKPWVEFGKGDERWIVIGDRPVDLVQERLLVRQKTNGRTKNNEESVVPHIALKSFNFLEVIVVRFRFGLPMKTGKIDLSVSVL